MDILLTFAPARLLKIKPHTFRKRAKEKFGM